MPRLRLALVIGGSFALVAIPAAGVAHADGGPSKVVRVSTPDPGRDGEANGDSSAGAVSADGRYVAFESRASNLVEGDTNNASDIFVRDEQSGTTARISLTVDGAQVLSDSSQPAITGDGRYVAFESAATKLVAGDTNRREDVFVRDLQTGTTSRVSVGSDGTEANADSRWLAMSPDGRYLAFASNASNLVTHDTNRRDDVFLHDVQAGTTTRVSLRSDGEQADGDASPLGNVAVSADGRYVAFESDAPNLVGEKRRGDRGVFVRDVWLGTTTRVDFPRNHTQRVSLSNLDAMSADGRFVTFGVYLLFVAPGDANIYSEDVFLRDLQAKTTRRILSHNGVPLHGLSPQAAISADGRFVAFRSDASNLVPCDTNKASDIFVRDLAFNTTVRISVAGDGIQANRDSFGPTISADGRHVAFGSDATNLVPGDSGFHDDVLLSEVPFTNANPSPVAAPRKCPARPRPPVLLMKVEPGPATDRATVLREGLVVRLTCNVECTKTVAVTVPRTLAVLLKLPGLKSRGRGPVTRLFGTSPPPSRGNLFVMKFPPSLRKPLEAAKPLEFTFTVVATAGGARFRVTKTVVIQ